MKQRGQQARGDKEWGKGLDLETSQPQRTQLVKKMQTRNGAKLI